VVIDGAFLGDAAAGGRWLASLRALAPEIDSFAPQPPAMLSHMHMEPEEPVPALGDHRLLDSLPAEAVDAFVDAGGPGSGSPLVHLELRHLGGALAEVPAGHGAIAKLGGEYALLGLGIPMDPSSGAAIRAQLDRVTGGLARWAAPRTYLNFTIGPAEGRGIFEPATYERLQAVKAAFDPGNVFRANPEIAPAPRMARAA
jgi:hypothetical protein